MKPLDDKLIIDLFLERSEHAVEKLSEKYGPAVKRTVRNILSDPRDSEECVSDVYFSIWNSIPPQIPDDLGAYVIGTARNQAIRRYRSNTAQKRNSFYDTALDELANCLAAPETAETQLEATELARAIDSFLAGLSREDRMMFLCRHYLGWSLGDIAKKLCIGEKRLSLRLFRIREKLKKHLMKEGLLTWIGR